MAHTPFFFWSDDGTVLPLALKVKSEGHPTTLYIHGPEGRDIGRGLVAKTTNPDPPARAVVIFDGVGHGPIGSVFRRRGHPVIGGNPFDADLEQDRQEGLQIMKRAGIKTPETHPFRSFPAAIQFLRGHAGEWFVKVHGDQVESTTFDTEDSETMIRHLQWLDSKGGHVDPFELQRRGKGTEVSINGWVDGTHFIRPFEYTIEEKRFLAGNLGPRTGCESNLVGFLDRETLPERSLLLVEHLLDGYVGPLDLNMLVDQEGRPTGLEWTARLGFDATEAWMRLLRPPIGEQLETFATGGLDQWEIEQEGDRALTLRISVPPYPTWDPRLLKKVHGFPLDEAIVTDPSNDPIDVMRVPDGVQVAGGSGIIGTVSSVGTDLKQMRREVLSKAAVLDIPNKQYRTDPVSRAERDLAALGDLVS